MAPLTKGDEASIPQASHFFLPAGGVPRAGCTEGDRKGETLEHRSPSFPRSLLSYIDEVRRQG